MSQVTLISGVERRRVWNDEQSRGVEICGPASYTDGGAIWSIRDTLLCGADCQP